MNQEEIGKFIKELRIKNNLTQKEFADSLGVTYQAVSKWENGKNIPDIAILKEISKLFDVNIDEILEGKISDKKSKNNKVLLIISSILTVIIIIGLVLFFIFNYNKNVEFMHVTSACEDFKITGLAAYDAKKSSLYISKVEYCGKNLDEKYKNITCTLYETYNNTTTKVSSCVEMHDMTLEEYLKNVEIKVDNYSSVCKDFNNIEMYLEIEAGNDTLMSYKHSIPLKIDNTCN